MRLVSVPVNKEVVSLQVGDFDGDGRADLAYYGNPAGLEILHNRGNGRFGDARKINTGDAIEGSGALSVGDLDRDGRDDLALITKDEILVIYQREKGKLGEPERLPAHPGQPPDGQGRRPRRRRRRRPGDAQRRHRRPDPGPVRRRQAASTAPRSGSPSSRSGPTPSARSTASRAPSC